MDHYRTPPSVHSFVELRKKIPEFTDPIAFLHICDESLLEKLKPSFRHIVNDTIVIGHLDDLQTLGEVADLGYRPIYYFNELVAVRVISS